jgi:flavodoxin
MSICYIFHSKSGNTRSIAERCVKVLGGDLIEVRDLARYNTITLYLVGGSRARNQGKDPIEPAVIDVTGYDRLVLGTPVWGRMPTPAINAAIDALKGCDGKNAVIYATCGGTPGETIPVVRGALENRGVVVKGSAVFTRRELNDEGKLKGFFDQIRSL